MTTPDWMLLGACREADPELFFPSDLAGVRRAQRVCATCEVVDECLEFALANHLDHGVWGGASERERKGIRRARARAERRARLTRAMGRKA